MLCYSILYQGALGARLAPRARLPGRAQESPGGLRGNHLSNTTCLTQVFFKCCEWFGKLGCSLTLQTAHKTNRAILDKQRQTSGATRGDQPGGRSVQRGPAAAV